MFAWLWARFWAWDARVAARHHEREAAHRQWGMEARERRLARDLRYAMDTTPEGGELNCTFTHARGRGDVIIVNALTSLDTYDGDCVEEGGVRE